MSKLKQFYSKHKQLVLYLVFGFITTVASLFACYATLKIGVVFFHDENGEPTELLDILGSTAQWIVGVLVAFITNKKWVFTEAEKGARSTLKQLVTFSGSRVLTYFLEVAVNLGVIALLEALGYKAFTLPLLVVDIEISTRVWAKVVSSVLVVVSNYFISKLIVFKSKKN
ncbi:MAG: GtrA family protein [Clostridia bacterium]|nr:GtrA family protein [Clostridia bacterium]